MPLIVFTLDWMLCHLRHSWFTLIVRCEGMKKFIQIRSPKFPILPGEKEELVNEGMYGKAVAEYLKAKLKAHGYDVPFYCCEDWGWWVEIKSAPFGFGVCIYCGPARDGPMDFFCTDGAHTQKKWSWKMFRFVDTTPWVDRLHNDIVAIFRADPEVLLIRTDLDEPFADDEKTEPDGTKNAAEPHS